MEGDSSGRLLLAEEGWRLHLRVAEAQVLVKIIKAINKVTYMAAQHLKAESQVTYFPPTLPSYLFIVILLKGQIDPFMLAV